LNFLFGAGKIVVIGAVAATGIFVIRLINRRDRLTAPQVLPISYWWAMLGLLGLAYFTKAQPILLPRYGLTLFAVGLPLFAWSLQYCLARISGKRTRALIWLAVTIVCLVEFDRKLPVIGKVRQDYQAHLRIVATLTAEMRQQPQSRCFSDDVAIRVLSHFPADRFLRSAVIPSGATPNGDVFLKYLRSEGVNYLIYFPTEDSLPVKFFPELGRDDNPVMNGFTRLGFANTS